MSRENIAILTLTAVATAPLIRQRFVDVSGATATAGEYALGVTRTDAATGEAVPVDVVGTALVTAGAAVAAGAAIQVGTGGKAITLAAGVAVGRALAAAAADGDVIEVLLIAN